LSLVWKIKRDAGGSFDWVLKDGSQIVGTGFAWTKFGARRQIKRACRSYARTGDARDHLKWEGRK
jgi:hypothetical protein